MSVVMSRDSAFGDVKLKGAQDLPRCKSMRFYTWRRFRGQRSIIRISRMPVAMGDDQASDVCK
jgi:hypothetical protein